jgi:DMSO/TMAO reductase YedYZ heme-binding membrane subunit
MKPIHWKRLHKLSYITYLLIYIHIGFNIYFRDPFYFAVKPNVWLFHLLPILYIILRLVNIIIPKYKQRAAT